jgi:hypothetical protein
VAEQIQADKALSHPVGGRAIFLGNYGKGFSLVIRRREVPCHENHERLELVVARFVSPESDFSLYARDNRPGREVHFVATQISQVKGESFLVKSIKVIGISQFVEEYNRFKPPNLQNTSLGFDVEGLFLEVDGLRIGLGLGQLRAYGVEIAIELDCPKEFLSIGLKPGKMSVENCPTGFRIRLADGSCVDSIALEGQTKIILRLKPADSKRVALEGFQGRRGGEIHLSKIEDKAWLGALTVGEGAFFVRSSPERPTLTPSLEIAMQDEQAIDKAAFLMGVRKTKGNTSESSGRMSWHVTAVGARMIDVLEALKPFLTPTKIAHAEEAIRLARASGFMTKREMKENRKRQLLNEIGSRPGSSTKDLGERLGIGYSYALKYLTELEGECKIISARSGTKNRPRLNWFINVAT